MKPRHDIRTVKFIFPSARKFITRARQVFIRPIKSASRRVTPTPTSIRRDVPDELPAKYLGSRRRYGAVLSRLGLIWDITAGGPIINRRKLYTKRVYIARRIATPRSDIVAQAINYF